MKNFIGIFLLIISLTSFFSSCSNTDSSELSLRINLEYNGEPLVFFEDVAYGDGRNFEFTRFSFYISEFDLIKDGIARSISEVEYFDLTASHADLSSATNGFTHTFSSDETLDYDAFQFNIGLTPEQNASTPQDHNSSSALSLSGEYWSNWNSYVFVKIEGRMDLDNDGVSDGIALHLGADQAKRMLNFDGLNSNDALNFKIEVTEIFKNFDIDANPRLHSLNQMPQIELLSDNLAGSVRLIN